LCDGIFIQSDVTLSEYTVSRKRPTVGLLLVWHTWMDFDTFWQKCYR